MNKSTESGTVAYSLSFQNDMKAPKLFALIAFFAFASAVFAQGSSQDSSRTVYYYLDCGCTCAIDSASAPTKHWIITSKIYAATYRDLAAVVKKFKRTLRARFNDHADAIQNVVVRYQKTSEAAAKSRKAKIKKTAEREYKIAEIHFRP